VPAFVFLFALFAAISSAHAKAVYIWQPIADNGCCEARIELSDAALAAGRARLHLVNTPLPLATPDAASDILTVKVTGYDSVGSALHLGAGEPATGRVEEGEFIVELSSITPEGLAGRIMLMNANDSVTLEGTAGEWTVTDFGADHGPCFSARESCRGATGRWVLVEDYASR
jgi:hypothetical protein